jgi:hypothetical protein
MAVHPGLIREMRRIGNGKWACGGYREDLRHLVLEPTHQQIWRG